jgi:hypothetical protein
MANLGLGGGGTSLVQSALHELVDRGFLISRAEFVHALASRSADRTPRRISSVCWCTRDRHEVLSRSIVSYRNAVEGSNALTFRIFDDSSDSGMRKLTREELHEISPGIRYAGLEEKQRLADQIVERGDGIDPHTVSFALFGRPGCGETTGANHNALLLSTLGEMVLGCDDDTLCEFARLEEDTAGLELSSAMDPTGYHFFESPEELAEKVTFERQDILARHVEILGAQVEGLVARAGTAGMGATLRLEHSFSPFANRLLKHGGTVVATASGICGDCGLANPRYLLAPHGAARDRLMASERLYRAAASNRLLLRAAPRTTVSEGTYFQAVCVGLDNRLPLPPFFPVGRNCDGIFGQTLRTCFPDWYIAHLPWAVHHVPPGERRFLPENLTALSIRLPEIVNLLLATFERTVDQSPQMERLDAAGRFFQDAAALPERDFLEYLRIHYLALASNYVEYLETQLLVHGREPTFWADDVEAHLERVRALPAGSDFCIPTDLREGRSNDEALTRTQQLVDQFGVLMESWPEILAAARLVRESEES